MSQWEAKALLVLAPGVFIRAGVRCLHCRSLMHPRHQWRVKAVVIDWVYECERCGTVTDTNMKVITCSTAWKARFPNRRGDFSF
jgi:hypothetical protein